MKTNSVGGPGSAPGEKGVFSRQMTVRARGQRIVQQRQWEAVSNAGGLDEGG